MFKNICWCVCSRPGGPAVAGAVTASPCAPAGTSAGKVLVAAGSSPISLTGSFDAAGSPISCIDVHRTTLVTACDAGDVAVWDAASHASLCRFPGVAGYECSFSMLFILS